MLTNHHHRYKVVDFKSLLLLKTSAFVLLIGCFDVRHVNLFDNLNFFQKTAFQGIHVLHSMKQKNLVLSRVVTNGLRKFFQPPASKKSEKCQ